MSAYQKFLDLHKKKGLTQRLGQHFCNNYIEGEWSNLFYADDTTAKKLIADWLINNQYYDELPVHRLDRLDNMKH